MNSYSKPSLKPLVEFCVIEDLIYFFHHPGIAIQMKDPSKFISSVCKLLDGKRNLAELSQELAPFFPSETPYLEKLLYVLDKEYLLEDSECNYPEKLTEYDIARWSRNIEFFGAHCKAKENKYSHQEKLKAAKVTVFGLGGVGSNILYNLAAMGVCNIKAVDFDKIELSNLNRQIIYNECDVGQLKSAVAKNRISNFLPHANIEFINKKISCSEDIEEFISNQDIVIAAIDHPREKIIDWFNLACVKKNVPFLCGSLDSRLVTYYGIVPGETGCVECWKLSKQKTGFVFQDIIQQENFISSLSPNVAIMPFISLVSGFVTNEFLKIITGIAEPQCLGKLCAFDFITSRITISECWDKNPLCSICSRNYS
ncbi:MAG: ThiF family adenylyltransferase [Gammaproteobacteria bacterium]|nr:ThiF family adenylyltransferase [Gammaproteobacteria bacterium]